MTNRNAHGRNLRRYRFSKKGMYYSVTACCLGRRRCFANLENGRIVEEEIRQSDSNELTETVAYVVMPDHLHWLFRLGGDLSLAATVGRVKGVSSRRILSKQNGPLWQRGYFDELIRDERALSKLGEYIIHNPVRAGLVETPEQYPLWDLMWRRSTGRG